MCSSVERVTGGSGAHDCYGRRQRRQQQVFPLQEATKHQREGLFQFVTGADVLDRLHHAGGLLRQDRLAVDEGVKGQAGPSERTEIQTNRKEIVLCPLSVHSLLWTLSCVSSHLHRLPAQRGNIVRLHAAG